MSDDFLDHVKLARMWSDSGSPSLVMHHMLHALGALAAERDAAKASRGGGVNPAYRPEPRSVGHWGMVG